MEYFRSMVVGSLAGWFSYETGGNIISGKLLFYFALFCCFIQTFAVFREALIFATIIYLFFSY